MTDTTAYTVRAFILELGCVAKDQHGFTLSEVEGPDEDGCFNFWLSGPEPLAEGKPVIPMRVRVPDKLEESELMGIGTLFKVASENLVRFIIENTPEEVPA